MAIEASTLMLAVGIIENRFRTREKKSLYQQNLEKLKRTSFQVRVKVQRSADS